MMIQVETCFHVIVMILTSLNSLEEHVENT